MNVQFESHWKFDRVADMHIPKIASAPIFVYRVFIWRVVFAFLRQLWHRRRNWFDRSIYAFGRRRHTQYNLCAHGTDDLCEEINIHGNVRRRMRKSKMKMQKWTNALKIQGRSYYQDSEEVQTTQNSNSAKNAYKRKFNKLQFRLIAISLASLSPFFSMHANRTKQNQQKTIPCSPMNNAREREREYARCS